ncbi:unnamed protein product [Sphenostylis stenocarpa]|uniref:Uncharacterized protein n=1 Tax=Sphenostylis stenocarpa TaxID=92480 RepID=A0AA86VAD8_9FABA|nr:unnamed protein product [Sphenostylis stenocarpa]
MGWGASSCAVEPHTIKLRIFCKNMDMGKEKALLTNMTVLGYVVGVRVRVRDEVGPRSSIGEWWVFNTTLVSASGV